MDAHQVIAISTHISPVPSTISTDLPRCASRTISTDVTPPTAFSHPFSHLALFASPLELPQRGFPGHWPRKHDHRRARRRDDEAGGRAHGALESRHRDPLRPLGRHLLRQHLLHDRARRASPRARQRGHRPLTRRLLLHQHLSQDTHKVLHRDGLEEEGRDPAAARLAPHPSPLDGPGRRHRADPLPRLRQCTPRGARRGGPGAQLGVQGHVGTPQEGGLRGGVVQGDGGAAAGCGRLH